MLINSYRVIFNPLTLSPALWLADTGSDSSVWSDLSGNGRDVVQATAGYRPSIVPSSMNGHQVRNFDGTNDFLASTLATYGTYNTLFVVFRPTSFSASYASIIDAYQTASFPGGGANEASYSLLINPSNKPAFYYTTPNAQEGADGIGAVTLSAAATYIHTVEWSNSGILTSINGATDMSIAGGEPSTVATSRYFTIGNSFIFSPRYYAGDIAEILLFNNVLSAQNFASVENYLASKYNVTLS